MNYNPNPTTTENCIQSNNYSPHIVCLVLIIYLLLLSGLQSQLVVIISQGPTPRHDFISQKEEFYRNGMQLMHVYSFLGIYYTRQRKELNF